MRLALALLVAFTAGAVPYIVAGCSRSQCPICLKRWAIWPVRNHLGRWVFVCRDHKKNQRITT